MQFPPYVEPYDRIANETLQVQNPTRKRGTCQMPRIRFDGGGVASCSASRDPLLMHTYPQPQDSLCLPGIDTVEGPQGRASASPVSSWRVSDAHKCSMTGAKGCSNRPTQAYGRISGPVGDPESGSKSHRRSRDQLSSPRPWPVSGTMVAVEDLLTPKLECYTAERINMYHKTAYRSEIEDIVTYIRSGACSRLVKGRLLIVSLKIAATS
jgi:hypothetical protein